MAIKFNMNPQKAIEAVLWLISRGQSNMYNIWKSLFAAEKYHLNHYGCPITGDQYVAMPHGTVPGRLYDMANAKEYNDGFCRKNNELSANRLPNLDYLSESNIEALEYGFKEYENLGFAAVRDRNHAEQAWRKNYNGGSVPIPFEDMIEEKWLKEDLGLLAESMVI